jgi:hypothetical protein
MYSSSSLYFWKEKEEKPNVQPMDVDWPPLLNTFSCSSSSSSSSSSPPRPFAPAGFYGYGGYFNGYQYVNNAANGFPSSSGFAPPNHRVYTQAPAYVAWPPVSRAWS